MQRIAIHLEPKQLSELRKQSGKTGVPVAEIIRRAIDKHLKNGKS